jgi:hypothetical protein
MNPNECDKRSIANSCVGQRGHGVLITPKKEVPHLEEVTNLGDLSLCKCASHEVVGKVNENHKC